MAPGGGRYVVTVMRVEVHHISIDVPEDCRGEEMCQSHAMTVVRRAGLPLLDGSEPIATRLEVMTARKLTAS